MVGDAAIVNLGYPALETLFHKVEGFHRLEINSLLVKSMKFGGYQYDMGKVKVNTSLKFFSIIFNIWGEKHTISRSLPPCVSWPITGSTLCGARPVARINYQPLTLGWATRGQGTTSQRATHGAISYPNLSQHYQIHPKHISSQPKDHIGSFLTLKGCPNIWGIIIDLEDLDKDADDEEKDSCIDYYQRFKTLYPRLSKAKSGN